MQSELHFSFPLWLRASFLDDMLSFAKLSVVGVYADIPLACNHQTITITNGQCAICLIGAPKMKHYFVYVKLFCSATLVLGVSYSRPRKLCSISKAFSSQKQLRSFVLYDLIQVAHCHQSPYQESRPKKRDM